MNANIFLEHKVDRLEEALVRLADAQAQTQRDLSEFKIEMSEFKNEMRFNLEKYREESRKDLESYREETDRKIEEYCEENRNEHRRFNQELGRISNKMGTIVEDLIYPAARPLISRYFKLDINDIDIYSNVSRRNQNKDREEFDIIASVPDKVFLVEVESTMRDSYVKEFKDKIIRFPDFLPEYHDAQLIPIMASLSMQPNTIHLLTQINIYAMAYREWDYMDLLNFDGLETRQR